MSAGFWIHKDSGIIKKKGNMMENTNPYYGGCKKVCVVKDRNKNESKS